MKHMRNNFAKDEEGVSPVVGVILMVAITVILAAIIAAFVLGLGAPKSAPKAGLRMVRANAVSVCIEHQGGDSIASGTINVFAAGAATPTQHPVYPFTAGESKVFGLGAALAIGSQVRFVDNVSTQQIASFTIQNVDSGATNVTCP